MVRLLNIHTVPKEEEGSTWLQLFFDLVYVAILIELGNRLSHQFDLSGIIAFVVIFLPVWWSWLEFVDYGRRYPVDDIGQRLLSSEENCPGGRCGQIVQFLGNSYRYRNHGVCLKLPHKTGQALAEFSTKAARPEIEDKVSNNPDRII